MWQATLLQTDDFSNRVSPGLVIFLRCIRTDRLMIKDGVIKADCSSAAIKNNILVW